MASARCTTCLTLQAELATTSGQLREARRTTAQQQGELDALASQMAALARDEDARVAAAIAEQRMALDLQGDAAFGLRGGAPPVRGVSPAPAGTLGGGLPFRTTNPSVAAYRYVPPTDFLPRPFVEAHLDLLTLIDRYAQLFHTRHVEPPTVARDDPSLLRSEVTLLRESVRRLESTLEAERATAAAREAELVAAADAAAAAAAAASPGGAQQADPATATFEEPTVPQNYASDTEAPAAFLARRRTPGGARGNEEPSGSSKPTTPVSPHAARRVDAWRRRKNGEAAAAHQPQPYRRHADHHQQPQWDEMDQQPLTAAPAGARAGRVSPPRLEPTGDGVSFAPPLAAGGGGVSRPAATATPTGSSLAPPALRRPAMPWGAILDDDHSAGRSAPVPVDVPSSAPRVMGRGNYQPATIASGYNPMTVGGGGGSGMYDGSVPFSRQVFDDRLSDARAAAAASSAASAGALGGVRRGAPLPDDAEARISKIQRMAI